ncbi:hypothetical protein IZU99_01355 [Oscillospiraceae bacterium CM]|nr:hypothetical protein IZU99_01355 [Oscillospiraceae bacterium CM]
MFANISYRFNGELQGYFKYVRETGDACEKYNFDPLLVDGKKVCLGFFEAGYTQGGNKHGKSRHVHIEKIDDAFKNVNSATGLTVVWCSSIKPLGRTAIVGWYTNAEVFRRVKVLPFGEIPGRGSPENGYVYNVVAVKTTCVHFPFAEIISPKWGVPKSRSHGFGIGRYMWYANEPEAKDYVANIFNEISQYSGENLIS